MKKFLCIFGILLAGVLSVGNAQAQGIIKHKDSGLCMVTKNGNSRDETPLILWDCGDGANGQWTWRNDYGGPIRGIGGKCVDVKGGSNDDGASVILYSCNDGSNQRWSWEGNTIASMGKCLSVYGDVKRGAAISLFGCDGRSDQNWDVYE